MEININDIESTVRVVDNGSILSPQIMEEILKTVLQAVRDQEEHRERIRAEQRITRGVKDELEEEWK
jgi:hypothetical protein